MNKSLPDNNMNDHMSDIKIVHCSSAHKRNDTRIFYKMCRTLRARGAEVYLVVADGLGDEIIEDVRIIDVGKPRSRVHRIIHASATVLEVAKKFNANIYHLHDPELLIHVYKLKNSYSRVIFDSHEDIPKQIQNKPYLGKFARIIISKLISYIEIYVCKRLDAVIAATPKILEKFENSNILCCNINNYPNLEEIEVTTDFLNRANNICYVGGVSKIRGAKEMVEAMEFLSPDIKLKLAGPCYEKELIDHLKDLDGWSKVERIEFLDREGVASLLNNSSVGLVTLQHTKSYQDSLPVKMFEYMSAGLPIVASNFDYWKELLSKYNCAIFVDPNNPSEIAEAITYLLNDRNLAKKMGLNGRFAVQEKFNWTDEYNKLEIFYKNIL